jgi:hypothetical protein
MASKKVRSIDATATPKSGQAEQLVGNDQSESEIAQGDDPRSVELSEPFVTRWSVLVSTTNWEKGAIICSWRNELEVEHAPAAAYSDDAWSRRVGGVTPQHVGRLRRVYQRFGDSFGSYANLYWTHFLASMEWDDAEMWLEGAAQSGWSVSKMRHTRWVASGSDPHNEPIDGEVVSASTDEDYSPSAQPVARDKSANGTNDISVGPRYDEPDFGDETTGSSGSNATTDQAGSNWNDDVHSEQTTSPFAALPDLPVDVAEALEQFKLAIIRHRSSHWAEISQPDMLQTLDALRSFAMQ